MKDSITFMPTHIYYKSSNAGPQVQLLGKTIEGVQVECTVTGHLPYFYMSKRGDESEVKSIHKDIVKVEKVVKSNIYGYAESVEEYFQVFLYEPKNLSSVSLKVRDYFRQRNQDVIIFESNVGYIVRFMVDVKIVGMGYINVVPEKTKKENGRVLIEAEHKKIENNSSMNRLPPMKILSLDIECIGENNRFPSAEVDPVVQIGNSISIYPDPAIVQKVLFCLKPVNPIPGVQVFTFPDEREMLMGWTKWVLSVDPDVLTGYNMTQFDIPYLLGRAEVLGLQNFRFFCRTGEGVRSFQQRQQQKSGSSGFSAPATLVVPGRIVFDMLEIVKKEFNLHTYSLNAVSATFLEEQKEDVHYSQIRGLHEGTNETRKRLGIYCLKDTYLPLRILYTKNLFINYCELARVTGVPFEYLVNRGQGVRVLSQLLRHAKQANYILPVVVGNEETYEGGYVMEPNRGFYKNPVVVLDYASLYPSIIMAYNLCYTTLIDKEQASKMDQTEYTESPTGDFFVKSTKKSGILPVILTSLLEGRKAVRKELSRTADPELKASLNARQLALKVSANSVYGFTGAARTGLPCIPISRSVTGFGREILKKTKEIVEGEYNKKDKRNLFVAYGDTDSVMVTQTGLTLEEAFQIGKEISGFVSKSLPDPLTLEFEKVYHPFVLINKKRYAGCAKGSVTDKGRIDTKGIETVRRDNCLLVRELMKESINKVFLHGDVDGAREIIRERVADLLTNKVGISQLIITKSITKQEADYAVTLAHVALAERMRKREGTGPGLGDRVPYVIIAGKGALHERSEDPVYALKNNLPIDSLYYLNNQITKPLERLLSYVIKDILVLLSPTSYVEYTGRVQTVREMPKGIGSFFKKKKVCVICRSGEYPVCRACDKSYAEVVGALRNKLYGLQGKYYLVMRECQSMQDSRHTAIVCCSRDCSIYYIRIELLKEITEVQDKYNQLIEYKQKVKEHTQALKADMY